MTKTTEEFKQTHEDNNNNKTNHLTQDQKDEYKLRQERVVRWDKYRIELMSFSYNFFIGLSLTFLGFFIAQTGLVLYKSCLLSVLQILTIGLLLISSGIGSFIVINRLKDFRKTAELTKKKKERFEHKCDIKQSNNIEKLKYQIFRLEEETHELGKNTWCFLRWQIWLFFAGLITGVVYLVIVNNVSSLR
jgi:hypothetical protein